MQSHVYITTALPYVNYPPHAGFALELLQADALARYFRAQGCEVLFLTGTDENGFKIARAALAQDTDPQFLCDQNSAAIQHLGRVLDASFDAFYRTSSEQHYKGATHLWRAVSSADTYRDVWCGWYCTGCERFMKQTSLLEGNICPEHLQPLEYFEEEVFLLNLQKFKPQIRDALVKQSYNIIPNSRIEEAIIKLDGYADFNISRKRESSWAVPIPGSPDEVMYPFFEALTSYINAVGYGWNENLLKRWWNNRDTRIIHCIGRGIMPFFTIYWPAMLGAADLRLPDTLFVHGHLLVNGCKMSKSLRNIVDPERLVNEYGQDAVRLYLLGLVPTFEDAEYSSADLAQAKAELECRLLPTIQALTSFRRSTPKVDKLPALQNASPSLIQLCEERLAMYKAQMDACALGDALKNLWPLIDAAQSSLARISAGSDTDADLFLLSDCVGRVLLPFLPRLAQELLSVSPPHVA